MRQETGRAGVDTFAGAAETGQVWPGVNDPPLTLVARLNWTIFQVSGVRGGGSTMVVASALRLPFSDSNRTTDHNRPYAPWYWQLRETTTRPRTARALETTSTSKDLVEGLAFRHKAFCLSAAAAAVLPRPRSGRGRRPKVGG
jgi:hypothetical protein